MNKLDKIRACYQHCCLKYISTDFMTNQTLRNRFGIAEKNYSLISRIISEEEYNSLQNNMSKTEEQLKDVKKVVFDKFVNNENIQHFVRIEDIINNLEAGIVNPLKISFKPEQAFFPLKISSMNKGKVSIVAYIFSQEPLKDKNNVLQSSTWKKITEDFYEKISKHFKQKNFKCVSKLDFNDDSSMFENDVYFGIMNDKEKSKYFEENQILIPKLHMALEQDNLKSRLKERYSKEEIRNEFDIDDDSAGSTRKILEEYPHAKKLLSHRFLLTAVDQGNKELVELLLDNGVDINAIDNEHPSHYHQGKTPLQIALRKTNKENMAAKLFS